MLLILSLLDIIAGIYLLFGIKTFVSIIGIFILLKGLASVFGSVVSKFYFDIMGIIDITIGLCLIFSLSINVLAFIIIIKGLFCIITS